MIARIFTVIFSQRNVSRHLSQQDSNQDTRYSPKPSTFQRSQYDDYPKSKIQHHSLVDIRFVRCRHLRPVLSINIIMRHTWGRNPSNSSSSCCRRLSSWASSGVVSSSPRQGLTGVMSNGALPIVVDEISIFTPSLSLMLGLPFVDVSRLPFTTAAGRF